MKTRQAIAILCVAVVIGASFTGLPAQERSSPVGAYGQTEQPGTERWPQARLASSEGISQIQIAYHQPRSAAAD